MKLNSSDTNKLIEKIKDVKDIRNIILHNLLILSLVDINKYVKDLKLAMNDILDLTGDIFGRRTATNKCKIKVKKSITKIMASRI